MTDDDCGFGLTRLTISYDDRWCKYYSDSQLSFLEIFFGSYGAIGDGDCSCPRIKKVKQSFLLLNIYNCVDPDQEYRYEMGSGHKQGYL